MLPKEKLKQCEEMLLEAKKKARRAKETTQTAGYKDFESWVQRNTHIQKPEIRDLNSLVSFCANALIGAGIRAAGDYFDQVQNDPKELKAAIERLKDDDLYEQSEWDIDDAE